jgi:uncharacterized SAM-binding protein YcdF (DUF218 family)
MDLSSTTAAWIAIAAAIVALAAVGIAVAAWLKLRRVRSAQLVLLGGGKGDLVDFAVSLQGRIDDLHRAVDEVAGALSRVDRRIDDSVSKTSILRYDAYEDKAGQSSATFALLDAGRTGRRRERDPGTRLRTDLHERARPRTAVDRPLTQRSSRPSSGRWRTEEAPRRPGRLASRRGDRLPVRLARPDTPPRGADAVVVSRRARTPARRGRRLIAEGISDTLVISDGLDPGWAEAVGLCKSHRATCFTPDPYSTQGEARWIAEEAKERGWDSVVVVTSTYHVRRSRMIVERCFHGESRGRGCPGRPFETRSSAWPGMAEERSTT